MHPESLIRGRGTSTAVGFPSLCPLVSQGPWPGLQERNGPLATPTRTHALALPPSFPGSLHPLTCWPWDHPPHNASHSSLRHPQAVSAFRSRPRTRVLPNSLVIPKLRSF